MKNSSHRIAGIIVLYNSDYSVLENIKSFIENLDLLIVSDNSEVINIDLKNKIQQISNKVLYASNNGNIGLCKALNNACRYLYKNGYTHAIYFDDDTKILSGYCNFLEYAFTLNDAAIISPLYSFDRNKTKKGNKIKKINFTFTSASIFNLNIMNELGYFDELMFLDCIDYEYCLKARKNGYLILENPCMIVQHRPAITQEIKVLGKTIKYGIHSPLRYYYQIRNLKYLSRKYHSVYCYKRYLIKILKVYLLFKDKEEYIKMIKKAKLDYKKHRMGEFNEN